MKVKLNTIWNRLGITAMLVIMGMSFALPRLAHAASDIEAVLDTSDGTSALSIQDVTTTEVTRIDSDGRITTAGTLTFSNLLNCNTIDTDATGILTCGTDEGITPGNVDISDDTNLSFISPILLAGDTLSLEFATPLILVGSSLDIDDVYVLNAGDTIEGALDIAIDTDETLQLTIASTSVNDYDAQVGFSVVGGTQAFTLGVDDSDGDSFKIATTNLGVGGDRFIIDAAGNVTIPDLVGCSAVETDGTGQLACSGAGASLFTDTGTSTFLTQTTDDFIIGATTLIAPFSIDVGTQTVRIGSGSSVNAVLSMFASDGDSGTITYAISDDWVFEGGGVAIPSTLLTVQPGDIGSASVQSNLGDINITAGGDDVYLQTGPSADETIGLVDSGDVVRVLADMETGFVGIGESTPDQILEIQSDAAADTQVTISNTAATEFDPQIGLELAEGTNVFTIGVDDSDGDSFKISTTNLGSGEDRFIIDSAGNVTIPDLGGCSAVETDISGQLSCSPAGASLFTDGGTSTYLTSTTDDFIVGATILVAPFSIDVSSNTVRIGQAAGVNAVIDMYGSDGDSGTITYTSSDSWYFNNGRVGIGEDSPEQVLEVTNIITEDTQITIGNTAAVQDVQIGFELSDGTNVFTLGVDDSDGDSFVIGTTSLGGGEDRFLIDTAGNVTIPDLISCSAVETDASGQLACSGAGASLFTDSGTSTFLTSTTDDFVIGATTLIAPFSIDVGTQTVRIGSGSSVNAVLSMFASDGDSGTITYAISDDWVFEGGGVAIPSTLLTVQPGDIGTASIQSNLGDINITAGTDDVYLQTGGSADETIGFVDSGDVVRVLADMETGFVGIGESTPDQILEIQSDAAADTQVTISNTATEQDVQIGFELVEGTNVFTLGVDDSDGDSFIIATTNLGGGEDRFVIDSLGSVSIPDLVSCSAVETDASGQLSCSGAGASLFTDSGTSTFLTSITDDFIIGATTFIAPFAIDVSAQTLRLGSGSAVSAVISMFASDGDTGSITYTVNDSWSFTDGSVGIGESDPEQILEVTNIQTRDTQITIGNTAAEQDVQIGFELSDGTNVFTLGVDDSDGDSFVIGTTSIGGGEDRFIIDSIGTVSIPDLVNCAAIQSAADGTLSCNPAGASLFTDRGTSAFLTVITDDLIVGASILVAPFSIDVDTNTVRIGEGNRDNVVNGVLAMYASDDDTGTITYTVSDAWVFEGGTDVVIDSSQSQDGGLLITNLVGEFDPQIGFALVDGTNVFTLGVDDSDSDSFVIATTNLGGGEDRFIIDSAGAISIPDLVSCSAVETNAAGQLACSGAGASLFTDSGTSTFLTSITDDFVIGATTLIAPFSIDVDANALRLGTGTVADAVITMFASDADTGTITYATSDAWVFEGGTDLVVDSSQSQDGGILISNLVGEFDPQIGFELTSGTNVFTLGVDDSDGDSFIIATTNLGGGEDRFIIDSIGAVSIPDLVSCSAVETNAAGQLACSGAGASLFTDSGTSTFLTSITDDFVIGATTLIAPFSIDVDANALRLGTGTVADAVITMFASDADTGTITYATSDAWVFEGGTDLVVDSSQSQDGGILISNLVGEFDPQIGFELTSGTNVFTLGVDDSEGDSFVIATTNIGGGEDRFIIDSTGVVSVPNLVSCSAVESDPNGQLSCSAAGASLFTDSGTSTFLTSTTDDFIIGATTLIAPFSVDVDANAIRFGTGTVANAVLTMFGSDGDTGTITYTTTDSWYFNNGSVGIGEDSPEQILEVTNIQTRDTQITIGNTATEQDVQIGFELSDGTNVFTMGVDDSEGDSFVIATTNIGGGEDRFIIDSVGAVSIPNLVSCNAIQSAADGTLSCNPAGASLYTDRGTSAFLTEITDDLIIGASIMVAPFSIDVDTNTVRIGEGNRDNVVNGVLAMYASDDDTGTITYTVSDAWVFEGGTDVVIDSSQSQDGGLLITNLVGEFDPQIGFALVDGTNVFTLGVDDSEGDSFVIATTNLGGGEDRLLLIQ